MKKSLIATLVAAPLLSLSSMAFAAEPVALTTAQMDGVTAGLFDFASVRQFNYAPTWINQANVFTAFSSNSAYVSNDNNSYISQ